MRARLAITTAGIECELREVVLRDKPAEMVRISPKATVPVLQLTDDTVIDESLEIMHWSLAQHDPLGWLNPELESLSAALDLIRSADTDFKYHLDRYKYPDRFTAAHATEHRDKAEQFIQIIEQRLAATPMLLGSHGCIADYAILPFVRQFANTDRDWFAATPYTHTQKWLSDFVASDMFLSVMKKYAQWHAGGEAALFPAIEDAPGRPSPQQ